MSTPLVVEKSPADVLRTWQLERKMFTVTVSSDNNDDISVVVECKGTYVDPALGFALTQNVHSRTPVRTFHVQKRPDCVVAEAQDAEAYISQRLCNEHLDHVMATYNTSLSHMREELYTCDAENKAYSSALEAQDSALHECHKRVQLTQASADTCAVQHLQQSHMLEQWTKQLGVCSAERSQCQTERAACIHARAQDSVETQACIAARDACEQELQRQTSLQSAELYERSQACEAEARTCGAALEQAQAEAKRAWRAAKDDAAACAQRSRAAEALMETQIAACVAQGREELSVCMQAKAEEHVSREQCEHSRAAVEAQLQQCEAVRVALQSQDRTSQQEERARARAERKSEEALWARTSVVAAREGSVGAREQALKSMAVGLRARAHEVALRREQVVEAAAEVSAREAVVRVREQHLRAREEALQKEEEAFKARMHAAETAVEALSLHAREREREGNMDAAAALSGVVNGVVSELGARSSEAMARYSELAGLLHACSAREAAREERERQREERDARGRALSSSEATQPQRVYVTQVLQMVRNHAHMHTHTHTHSEINSVHAAPALPLSAPQLGLARTRDTHARARAPLDPLPRASVSAILHMFARRRSPIMRADAHVYTHANEVVASGPAGSTGEGESRGVRETTTEMNNEATDAGLLLLAAWAREAAVEQWLSLRSDEVAGGTQSAETGWSHLTLNAPAETQDSVEKDALSLLARYGYLVEHMANARAQARAVGGVGADAWVTEEDVGAAAAAVLAAGWWAARADMGRSWALVQRAAAEGVWASDDAAHTCPRGDVGPLQAQTDAAWVHVLPSEGEAVALVAALLQEQKAEELASVASESARARVDQLRGISMHHDGAERDSKHVRSERRGERLLLAFVLCVCALGQAWAYVGATLAYERRRASVGAVVETVCTAARRMWTHIGLRRTTERATLAQSAMQHEKQADVPVLASHALTPSPSPSTPRSPRSSYPASPVHTYASWPARGQPLLAQPALAMSPRRWGKRAEPVAVAGADTLTPRGQDTTAGGG